MDTCEDGTEKKSDGRGFVNSLIMFPIHNGYPEYVYDKEVDCTPMVVKEVAEREFNRAMLWLNAKYKQ